MPRLRLGQLWRVDRESRCSAVSIVPNSLWKCPKTSSEIGRLLAQTIPRGCPHSRRERQGGIESSLEGTDTEYRRRELRRRSRATLPSRIHLSLGHTVCWTEWPLQRRRGQSWRRRVPSETRREQTLPAFQEWEE